MSQTSLSLSSRSLDILTNAAQHCIINSFWTYQLDADMVRIYFIEFTSNEKYQFPNPLEYGDRYLEYIQLILNTINGTPDIHDCIRYIYRKNVYETHYAYKQLLEEFKQTIEKEIATQIFSEPYFSKLLESMYIPQPDSCIPYDPTKNTLFQQFLNRHAEILNRVSRKQEKQIWQDIQTYNSRRILKRKKI